MKTISKKEKKLAMTAIIVIGCWFSYSALLQPALARMETLQRRIPEKNKELELLGKTCAKIKKLEKNLQQVHSQAEQFLSDVQLEKALNELFKQLAIDVSQVFLEITSKKINESYSSTQTIIELNNVTMKILFEFLSNVEEKYPTLLIQTLNITNENQSLKIKLIFTQIEKSNQ